jgi:tetratricopeptide (TPR) repeat protein
MFMTWPRIRAALPFVLGALLGSVLALNSRAVDLARLDDLSRATRRTAMVRQRAMAHAYYLRSAYLRHRVMHALETTRASAAEQEGIVEAMFFLERALECAPRSRYLWWEYAALNNGLGRVANVITAYEHLNALEPRLDLTIKLGDLYQLRGDAPRAVACYTAALAREPDSSLLHERIADVYIEEGFKARRRDDEELALEQFRQAIARMEILCSTNAKSRWLVKKGLLHELTGDAPRALVVYHTAIGVDANNPDPYLRAAQLQYAAGERAERNGNGSEARRAFNEAAALLKAVVPDMKQQPEMLNFTAYVMALSGTNLDVAERLVEQALARDAANGAYIDTLGWVYFQRGDTQRALAKVQRALELEGEDPVITDHLGDIYLRLGLPDKARAMWQKSLQLDAQNKAVEQKLRQLR